MKFPCVELYFELESGPLDIRIWMKTDNELKDGSVSMNVWVEMDILKDTILKRQFIDRGRCVKFLAGEESIAAFQVTYRNDINRTAIIVYREWP